MASVYGWLNWRQHAADEGSIRIVPLARGTLLRDLAIGLCGGVALGAAMHSFTDAALPWLDALLTGLSLVGQWWQARRHVACWWVWIAVDVVYVGAYLFKSLHVTAALYVFFLGLAVFGLRAWSAAALSHRWQRSRAGHAWRATGSRQPGLARACRPRSASTHHIHAWRGSTSAPAPAPAAAAGACRPAGLPATARPAASRAGRRRPGHRPAVEFQLRDAAIRRDPHAHRQRRRCVRMCLQPFQHALRLRVLLLLQALLQLATDRSGVGHPMRRGFLRGNAGTPQCQCPEQRGKWPPPAACTDCVPCHRHRLPPALASNCRWSGRQMTGRWRHSRATPCVAATGNVRTIHAWRGSTGTERPVACARTRAAISRPDRPALCARARRRSRRWWRWRNRGCGRAVARDCR